MAYYVQEIQGFARPKVDLEQYPTGAEIASRMLFTVCVLDMVQFVHPAS